MRDFFAPNLNVTPELALVYLSPPHLVYLAGCLAVILVICLLMPRRSAQVKDTILKILIFSIIASEAARVIWGFHYGLFSWQSWLPLHLCSMIVFTGPIMLYTRNEKLKNLLISFTYGVSMPAAFFAMLTPDKPVYSAFTFEFFQTMYSHGAIVCVGIYLLAVMGYRPRMREVPRLLGLLLCLLVINFSVNHFINWIDPKETYLQANYLFLTFAPRDTPLEALASFAGRYYIVPTVALLIIVWVLLFAPWEIIYKNKQR